MLSEALEVWRKAESKRESDVTLARMNYSRAASESDVVASGSAWHFCGYDVVASGSAWHFCGYDVVHS